MSGRLTPISGDRRTFLRQLGSLLAMPFGLQLLSGCMGNSGTASIPGRIVGANHQRGHLLRKGVFPDPVRTIRTKVLVAGGGVSGLSAARRLVQQGVSEVLLLELDDRVGGNSISGANQFSAYPWGAHYLPVPNPDSQELIAFLHHIGVIRSFDASGLPVYDEYALCHDPEERLFINGTWQEGLVPQFGIAESDKQQIDRFFKQIAVLKAAKGIDGKYAFTIPLDLSSCDPQYRDLDQMSFASYLEREGYTSPYLLWYLSYCCKDDYGALPEHISAWAGLHYFAARKGVAANASGSAVLTWPQGNAFLVEHLRREAACTIRTAWLVTGVELSNHAVLVKAYDCIRSESVLIEAERVIMATPQYVTQHLLGGLYPRTSASYAPWVTANITLKQAPQSKGVQLCWDNVLYGQPSVGYVYANHQSLKPDTQGVITYYLPLTGADTTVERGKVYGRQFAYWRDRIVAELGIAHPGIAKDILHMDIWIWGHGMVRPTPGYIWGSARSRAAEPLDDRVFFAHTDLSGISIFEEGFYQGIKAADQTIASWI